ncbi:Uncharacterized protein APZ42_033865 [Daphnia magna]|uniref:Uncharacterized protein n=1 Tax=Daphnia magna TaxID=35525 RepID=A0A164KNH3_9CRUS|nr:Uncharacterized protein APZ42_033865 [Daphnia magna]
MFFFCDKGQVSQGKRNGAGYKKWMLMSVSLFLFLLKGHGNKRGKFNNNVNSIKPGMQK